MSPSQLCCGLSIVKDVGENLPHCNGIKLYKNKAVSQWSYVLFCAVLTHCGLVMLYGRSNWFTFPYLSGAILKHVGEINISKCNKTKSHQNVPMCKRCAFFLGCTIWEIYFVWEIPNNLEQMIPVDVLCLFYCLFYISKVHSWQFVIMRYIYGDVKSSIISQELSWNNI